MTSVYETLPECGERKCKITRTEDIATLQYIFQHGENPEAALLIDRYVLFHSPEDDIRARLRAWTERIHRYEDGDPPDDSDHEEVES